MSKAKNITQLQDQMLDSLDKFQNGEIDNNQITGVARITGVIVKSLAVQVNYKKLTGNPEEIRFLESK